ncbi:MAG: hypothetical protein JXR88_16345 [Clostridia bacterium]|nr:hypothetical protein [Clostridia bacterium]
MAEENKAIEKKKGSLIKAILFLLIFFIVIPVLGLIGFYLINDTFQYRLNAALSDAPVVGSYFRSLPTRAEKDEQVRSIAEYYLEIGSDRAVDKLTLMKSQDSQVYDDIVRVMMQMDPNSTRYILEAIRDNEMKGNVVSSTLDEINNEVDTELQASADELVAIPLETVRNEMYKIINDGLNGHRNLARILEKMDPTDAYDRIGLLDDVDQSKVMEFLDSTIKDDIRKEMNNDLMNTQKLISMSEIYDSKDPDELVSTLGNTSNYTVDELATIFKEIGVLKTGEILSQVTDEQFITDVITKMKNNEILENGSDEITKDILKTLKIYKEFDDNILQLTNIYGTMSSEEVANLLKRLITNSSLPQVYVLDSGDVITISDEMMAYEVLKNFDDTRIAEIIGFFEDSLASEVSKKLTVPGY